MSCELGVKSSEGRILSCIDCLSRAVVLGQPLPDMSPRCARQAEQSEAQEKAIAALREKVAAIQGACEAP